MKCLLAKRILVTRPRVQAADLCDKLDALGAESILFPTIEIAPMEDTSALDQALTLLHKYQWVVFTSVNGVAAFWKRMTAMRPNQDVWTQIKVAAIGPATARALERRGVRAQFIPEEYVAEAILPGMGDVNGRWVLLPRADIAREALADELARRGAVVHEIATYRTVPAAPDAHGLAELRRGVDAVTFTSSSTVSNFVALLSGGTKYVDTAILRRMGHDGVPMPSLGDAAVACIGPVTAQTAREADLPVDIVASEYTMDGLVASLADFFAHPELRRKENRWKPERSI